MSYIVGRPIEGISINGDEWLLDDDGEVMEFETHEEAVKFLGVHGIDLDFVNIVEEE